MPIDYAYRANPITTPLDSLRLAAPLEWSEERPTSKGDITFDAPGIDGKYRIIDYTVRKVPLKGCDVYLPGRGWVEKVSREAALLAAQEHHERHVGYLLSDDALQVLSGAVQITADDISWPDDAEEGTHTVAFPETLWRRFVEHARALLPVVKEGTSA